MYKIQNHVAAETAEFMAIGELLDGTNGSRLALEVLQRHGTKDDLVRRILDRKRDQPLTQAADSLLGSAGGGAAGAYSLSRAIGAAIKRDWSEAGLERDVSNIVTSNTDRVPNGFYVPFGLMARDFNVGTATQAGNLLGKKIATDYVRDPLANLSALGRLGATFVYGLTTTENLPRLKAATSWANEGPPQFESEVSACVNAFAETASVPLTPKRISTQLTMSRQALLQATPTLDSMIGRHLIGEIIKQIEKAAVSTSDGTGDTPVGLLGDPLVPLVEGGTNGAQLEPIHLSTMEAYVSYDPANAPENAGFLLNPDVRAYIRSSSFLYPGLFQGRDLLGYRTETSIYLPGGGLTKGTATDCAALAFSSDWSQLVIGFYGPGVDVLVDRVTLASEGKVRITASAYVGIGINNPGAFAVMTDAIL